MNESIKGSIVWVNRTEAYALVIQINRPIGHVLNWISQLALVIIFITKKIELILVYVKGKNNLANNYLRFADTTKESRLG